MISIDTLPMPTSGVNISDSPVALSDDQARSMDNMMISTMSMESIRPNEAFVAKVPRDSAWDVTDDIYVYRKRSGDIQYIFAYNGNVYYSATKYGGLHTIPHTWTKGHRISVIAFNDNLYIFNGYDANMVWNGSTVRLMGITPPETAATLSNPSPVGTDARGYYYTYYNSTSKIESNESPVAYITTATAGREGGTVDIDVTASTDTQVDKIRIYRTGFGLVTPKLAQEVSNISATITDDSVEDIIVVGNSLEFDHDVPQPFLKGILQNNRLMCWGVPGADDEVWISNEFEPEYFPILPFYDSQIIKSGGPIIVNPGDGSGVMAVVPWGGSVIALKRNAAYRIQETEVGFYGYQSMSIPGCVAGDSAKMTVFGLVYLSDSGFVLLDENESIQRIGDPIANWTCNIGDYSKVSAASYRGMYVVSFKIGASWYSVTFNIQRGWQGSNTGMIASCYFNDINILLAGCVNETFAYIEECQIDKFGSVPSKNSHRSIRMRYQDKAREYFPNFYSRIREIRIGGETIGRIGDQVLTLNVYDGNDILLDSNEFIFPVSGSVNVGIGGEAMSRFLSFEIVGYITRPIRISAVRPTVEQIGYGWGE